MKAVWKTELGHVRNNNEDALMVDEKQGIFLLADGMGGHNAGEIASDIAVKEAYAYILKEAGKAEESAVPGVLEEALFRAHRAIQTRAALESALYGMGTTLVELYIRGKRAYFCHAGDSRVYLFRGTLRRMTRDHTVGETSDDMPHKENEKMSPRFWRALTQAVGPRGLPVPDTSSFDLMGGDILLLCTDGLTDMLSDDEMQDIFMHHNDDCNALVDGLVSAANEKGGRDNITAIAVKV